MRDGSAGSRTAASKSITASAGLCSRIQVLIAWRLASVSWRGIGEAADRRERAVQHPQAPRVHHVDQLSVAAEQLLDRGVGGLEQVVVALEQNHRRDTGLAQHIGVQPPDRGGPV